MTAAYESPPFEPDRFFSEAPAPMAVLDHAGRIVRANAAFSRALPSPHAAGEAGDLSLLALLRPEDREQASVALTASEPTTFEARPAAFDGAESTRVLRFVAARSGAGLVDLVGVELPGDDRLAHVEQELRDQAAIIDKQSATLQVFSQLLDTAPIVVWAVDANGTYTMFEGRGLELIGSHHGEAVGENALRMHADSPDVARAIARALEGEASQRMTTPRRDVHFDSWFLPLDRCDGTVGAMGLSIDVSKRVVGEEELRAQLALITEQSATIRALAMPIIQVWDGVLCLPVMGAIDSERAAAMTEALLEAVVRERAAYAIVDLTGVEVIDASTADHLVKLLRAARLIGADGVLCGVRPAVAQTVTSLGLELGSIPKMRTLSEALKWCLAARAGSAARWTTRSD